MTPVYHGVDGGDFFWKSEDGAYTVAQCQGDPYWHVWVGLKKMGTYSSLELALSEYNLAEDYTSYWDVAHRNTDQFVLVDHPFILED